MELFLQILFIMGISLLVILAFILLILIIPIFYDIDAGTNNLSAYVNMKIKTVFNIVTVEMLNDLILLKIFGFIKIKLKSNEKKKEINDENELEIYEINEYDEVPENIKGLRRLKLKTYIVQRKAKEKLFKFRKTIKNINEYSYKMELLKKTIQFIEKIIDNIKPKDSMLKVEMGCGSIDLTGKLVGMLSMLQVRYTNLVLMPNFEKATLNISLEANGSVMPIKLVILAVKYYNEDALKELRALRRKEHKNA